MAAAPTSRWAPPRGPARRTTTPRTSSGAHARRVGGGGEDYVFFLQAEDGIRDVAVTGVQTSALPISFGGLSVRRGEEGVRVRHAAGHRHDLPRVGAPGDVRLKLPRVYRQCLVVGG